MDSIYLKTDVKRVSHKCEVFGRMIKPIVPPEQWIVWVQDNLKQCQQLPPYFIEFEQIKRNTFLEDHGAHVFV